MPLYARCPKCGADSAGQDICPACGLIYGKYLKARVAPGPKEDVAAPSEESAWHALLLFVPQGVPARMVYARAGLLATIAAYGAKLAVMDIPGWEMASSLIHLPMVPIHEFGHLLFMPLGEFMHLLGGSLFQVGLPLVFGGIFLVKQRDPFAASVMLWWSGVALMDVGPYVYDAWKPQHVLLTGRTGDEGAHDFIDVLGDLGLLHRAQAIGYAVHHLGLVMVAAALGWGAYLLWRQYHARTL